MNEELLERHIRSLELYNRGSGALSRGRLDQARKIFDQAREIFPDILLNTAEAPPDLRQGLQSLRGQILEKIELLNHMREEGFRPGEETPAPEPKSAAQAEPARPAPPQAPDLVPPPRPESQPPVPEVPAEVTEPPAPEPDLAPEPAAVSSPSAPEPQKPEEETVSLDELLAEADEAFSEAASPERQPGPVETEPSEPAPASVDKVLDGVAIQGLLGEISQPESDGGLQTAETPEKKALTTEVSIEEILRPDPFPDDQVSGEAPMPPKPESEYAPEPELKVPDSSPGSEAVQRPEMDKEEETGEEIDLEALGISSEEKPPTESDALELDLDVDAEFDKAQKQKSAKKGFKLAMPRISISKALIRNMENTFMKYLAVVITLSVLAAGGYYFRYDFDYKTLPQGLKMLADEDEFSNALDKIRKGLDTAKLSSEHKKSLIGIELSFTDSYSMVRDKTIRILSALGMKFCTEQQALEEYPPVETKTRVPGNAAEGAEAVPESPTAETPPIPKTERIRKLFELVAQYTTDDNDEYKAFYDSINDHKCGLQDHDCKTDDPEKYEECRLNESKTINLLSSAPPPKTKKKPESGAESGNEPVSLTEPESVAAPASPAPQSNPTGAPVSVTDQAIAPTPSTAPAPMPAPTPAPKPSNKVEIEFPDTSVSIQPTPPQPSPAPPSTPLEPVEKTYNGPEIKTPEEVAAALDSMGLYNGYKAGVSFLSKDTLVIDVSTRTKNDFLILEAFENVGQIPLGFKPRMIRFQIERQGKTVGYTEAPYSEILNLVNGVISRSRFADQKTDKKILQIVPYGNQ